MVSIKIITKYDCKECFVVANELQIGDVVCPSYSGTQAEKSFFLSVTCNWQLVLKLYFITSGKLRQLIKLCRFHQCILY